MVPRIEEVKYVRDYTLHLRFADGTEGDIDLKNELDGEIFIPLKNLKYFKNVILDSELHTITWPNGADFAPEFLYNLIRIPAQ